RHTRFSRDWSSDVCSSDLSTTAPRMPLPEPPSSARCCVSSSGTSPSKLSVGGGPGLPGRPSRGFHARHEPMTKSELIEILTQRQAHLKADDVDLAVKSLLEMMGASLSRGERIEVRGFGSFSLHYRPPRTGRNPKTGEAV